MEKHKKSLKKIKRQRKHGFRGRQKTRTGKALLKRRRLRGKKKVV